MIKTKRIKMLMCIFFTLLIILDLGIVNSYAIDVGAFSKEIIGKIVADGKNVDSIKIDVFKLELSARKDKCKEYSHVYSFSCYPDEQGEFSFDRPSPLCYVSVDTESIPAGFGLTLSEKLIRADENRITFELFEIKDFVANVFDDSISFYNENGDELTTNSEYKVDYGRNFAYNMVSDKDLEISCYFGDEKLTKLQSTSKYSMLDKIENLYKKHYISDLYRLELLLSNVESGRISDESEVEVSYAILANSQNHGSVSEEISTGINNLLSNGRPVYNDESVYNNGFFSIHYEEGEYTTGQLFSIYVYLNYTKESLCLIYGFDEPNLEPESSRYNVYLVTDTSNGGYTQTYYQSGVVYSYIVLRIKNGVVSNDDYGTAAHEFTHAVQYCYYPFVDQAYTAEMGHFNEAVANSVRIRIVSNCNLAEPVGLFQNTPQMSLLTSPTFGTYSLRHYGAVLFPLCIEQEFNELATIREIYEENQTVNNIYTAIDNVMQDNNSSLGEIYAKCALYNYDVQEFYDYNESDWQSCAALTDMSTNHFSTSLTKLASRYFKITDSTYSNIAFTLPSSGYNSIACLQRVDTVDGTHITSQCIFSNSGSVTVIFELDEGDSIGMILSNKSISSILPFSVDIF